MESLQDTFAGAIWYAQPKALAGGFYEWGIDAYGSLIISQKQPYSYPVSEWTQAEPLVDTTTWLKIAEFSPTSEALQAQKETIYAAFRQGEQGKFSANFRLPIYAKESHAAGVDSLLRSKGVTLWRNSDWDGNTLNVYFTVGQDPISIGLALVAALALIGVVIVIVAGIVIFKLVKPQIDATTQRKQQLQDTIIKASSELPPDEQIAALQKAMDAESASALSLNPLSGLGEATQALGKAGGQALIVVAVLAGLALLLFVFMRGR